MVKRIFKIIAIVLASFVVVAGGAIGISALRGGFEEEEINITKLYFGEDELSVSRQIQTLDDVVTNISFKPDNATNKELKVEVLGNENGIISVPSKIYAGEDFTLDVKQDDKGNNIGGVVTIKASQGIAEVVLTVVVDVVIPDNSLYFTGEDTGKITTAGKNFTMAIDDKEQYVYLKSELVNAFYLQANNQNLKNAEISYTYYREGASQENPPKPVDISSKSKIERIYNAHENLYNYFYKIPLVTDSAGTIDIEAKMHRTSEIEKKFKEAKFETLPNLLKNQNNSASDKESATLKLSEYNDFLNNYIKYFDTNSESYSFFKNVILSDGKITLSTLSQVEQSFNYVYVKSKATINVTAIKLSDFTATSIPREYQVVNKTGNELLYSVSGVNSSKNIVEDFKLEIKTSNDDAIGADAQKDYMFESLAVNPYLYLDVSLVPVENIDELNETITWAGRTYKYLIVYGFDGSTPLIEPNEDKIVTGYLLLLQNSDEYLSVSEVNVNNEKHWKISCNVPMINDKSSFIGKALYLNFAVSGIGANSTSVITKQAFTRVFIKYEDLNFIYDDVNNIAINELDKYMSINTSDIEINSTSDAINNPNSYYNQLTVNRYTQNISNNINSTYIDNLDYATYKNVMYFAETTSNRIDGEYCKVATVGKYNFVNYANAISGSGLSSNYMYGDAELIGERIGTYNVVNNEKVYYLHALNASTVPVKLFAVVYLSDKNGYPIDINGRRITIDESNQGETPITLVVLRITDITESNMPSVNIESYVDNVNFFTKSTIANIVGRTDDYPGIQFEQGFISRNHLNYFVDESGNKVSDATLNSIHDYLSLKLLKNNYFSLYVTNFDLETDGSIKIAESTKNDITFKDIYGNNVEIAYSIYNHNNNQFALNAMCEDFNNYSLYTDSQEVQVYGTPEILSVDGDWESGMNATMIRFVLHSSKDDDANKDPKIYLNPENSSIPYSKNLIYSESEGEQQIARNNFVVYHTYKLEIEDVELSNDITLQNKLHAKYAKLLNEENVNKGDLEFNYDLGGIGSGIYVLPISDGNINYKTFNNLVDADSQPNLQLVDCSQAGTSIDNPEGMDGSYFYDSLTAYINYYTNMPNSTAITYKTASNVISLAEDVEFTNLLQDKVEKGILFGDKQYPIKENGAIGTVNINGYVLDVTLKDKDRNIWSLFIEKGTVFPLVIDSEEKALIYNQEFVVSTTDYINYYIQSFDTENIDGPRIKVNKNANIILSNGESINYNANSYLDDSNSAITPISREGISSAYVNFVQGEEVGRFVEDENGKYKRVYSQTNENSYEYVLVNGTEDPSEKRYSIVGTNEDGNKMGVKVYMVVTIPFMYDEVKDSYEYTFFKAIEYELLQEEIEIVGYNSTSATDINSNVNDLKVSAGSTSKIMLGSTNNAGPYIAIKAYNEEFFFQHVDFKIISSIPGIKAEVSSDYKYIEISVADLASNIGFTLSMEYLYKNNVKIERFFYLEAEANVDFIYNPETVGIKEISSTDKAYEISLNANNEYNIVDIFNEDRFTISGNVKKIILKDKDNEYDNTIVIDNVNAEYDENIIYGNKLYTIILVLENNKELELNYKLYVNIIPSFIISTSDLTDNGTIEIFNEENLFGKYIKLFNGNSTNSDMTNTEKIINGSNSNYSEIFTITSDVDTLALLDATALSNGKVKIKILPDVDITLNLTLKYITYSGYEKEVNFVVKVRGVKLNYSPSGDLINDSVILNSNITINVDNLSDFAVDKYFNFALSNSSIAIKAELVDANNNIVTNLETNKAYYLAYYKVESGREPELIGTTGFTVTIVEN